MIYKEKVELLSETTEVFFKSPLASALRKGWNDFIISDDY